MTKILVLNSDGSSSWIDKVSQSERRPPKAVVSDDLGCIAQQVDELRADAKASGFSAIEYKPDPTTLINGHPTFYQLHCSSPDQLRRYEKHLKLPNCEGKNGSGATLAPESFEQAKGLINRNRRRRAL